MSKGIPGAAVGAVSLGIVFMWSAVKGAKVTDTLKELLSGKQPVGMNVYPITQSVSGGGGVIGGNASAGQILSVAASFKGQCYGFGAGHGGKPCSSRCTDCSSYVSCVLNKVGVLKTTMATGGLAGIGVSVPYDQRMPGDIIVWNGGTGGGHTGIIIDGGRMWHNPCTGCGGVQIGRYPTGTRTAATAVVRRVDNTLPKPKG